MFFQRRSLFHFKTVCGLITSSFMSQNEQALISWLCWTCVCVCVWSSSQLYLVTDTHTQLMLKNKLMLFLTRLYITLLLLSSSPPPTTILPCLLSAPSHYFPLDFFLFLEQYESNRKSGSTSGFLRWEGRGREQRPAISKEEFTRCPPEPINLPLIGI